MDKIEFAEADSFVLRADVHSESHIWAIGRQTLVDYIGADGMVEGECHSCGKAFHFEAEDLPETDIDCECGKALIRYGGEDGE